MGGQRGLGLAHRVLAEVEDRRGQQAGRAALGRARAEVLERADPAARDDRHVDRLADRAQQIEVVADLRAVAVHRREQDLARAERARVHRPLDRVELRAGPAAVGHDLPARARVVGVAAARVDRHDDALVAELVGARAHELEVVHRGGVQRHLVGAGAQHPPHVFDACGCRRRP